MSEDAKPRAVALVDVTCKHCHRRFGFGWPAPAAPPRCPGCGREHEVTKLDELMSEIEEFEEQQDLADAIALQIAHGRTLDHVAATTGVGRATLRSFLTSGSPLPAELYRKACAALGVEP